MRNHLFHYGMLSLGLLAILLLLLGISMINLSITSRIKANILVVEGWLPPDAIEKAYQEFLQHDYEYLVTTGLQNTNDYFILYTNGRLVFNPTIAMRMDTSRTLHSIEVRASSELSGDNRAHFRLQLNDTVLGGFTADKHPSWFKASWKGKLSSIDSISIIFDNDKVGPFGDRNLYVKELFLDDKYKIPYQYHSLYEVKFGDQIIRMHNDYTSYAELARRCLLELGADSSKIIMVTNKKVRINRTITSALAFRDWATIHKATIKGINVISLGNHSLRTYLTYKKLLHNIGEVGILSLPDTKAKHSISNKLYKTMHEIVGIAYYMIVLWFY